MVYDGCMKHTILEGDVDGFLEMVLRVVLPITGSW